MLNLTKSQQDALQKLEKFLQSDRKIFVLAGYAGTGKSTIISEFFKNEEKGLVGFLGPTGRSVSVLSAKGIPAITIHHYQYSLLGKEGEELIFALKKMPIRHCEVIVVDEASMVDKEIFKDLLKFPHKIIFVGDPFQLPPIGDDPHLFDHPDVILTEIIRQAEESGIVRLATKIRNRETITPEKGEDYEVLTRQDIKGNKNFIETCLRTDQILVTTNKDRNSLNQYIRQKLGFSGLIPQAGEKVVLTKNMWNTEIGGARPVNGMTGECKMAKVCKGLLGFLRFKPDYTHHSRDLKTDFANFYQEPFDDEWDMNRATFDFGYAITVWKYQGSEAEDIVAFIPKYANWVDRDRLLYTAVTRAKKHLHLVI